MLAKSVVIEPILSVISDQIAGGTENPILAALKTICFLDVFGMALRCPNQFVCFKHVLTWRFRPPGIL